MSKLFASASAEVEYRNKKEAKFPTSSNFYDGKAAAGFWLEDNGDKVERWEQVVGESGVYLVITDDKTDEIISDDRPWQMFS